MGCTNCYSGDMWWEFVMDRVIKFRYWWQFKDFLLTEVFTIDQIENHAVMDFVCGDDFPAYPLTSGKDQFTGLQDQNGVDIYEGDILHQLDPVIWNPFSVYYCADSGCYLAGGTLSSRVIKDVELVVVGNIYENPTYMSDGK